ncbi:MAG: PP0621 family protein [Campylobacterota bacterium]|nr:PP0621 family protein [Campylobacterota bacterium]
MLLKLIIFAVIFFVVYKFFGGTFPQIGGNKKDKVPKGEDKKKIEEDTLVECEKCGTYVTHKESIIVKGKTYCSKECAGF